MYDIPRSHDPRPWFWSRSSNSGSSGSQHNRGRRFSFRKIVDFGRHWYHKAKKHLPKIIHHSRKLYQAGKKHFPDLIKSARKRYPELVDLVEETLKNKTKETRKNNPV